MHTKCNGYDNDDDDEDNDDVLTTITYNARAPFNIQIQFGLTNGFERKTDRHKRTHTRSLTRSQHTLS